MAREIPVIYDPNTKLHRPQYEVFNAEKKPHSDIPERMQVIEKSLEESGIAEMLVSEHEVNDQVITDVHNGDYVDFLRKSSLYAAKVEEEKQIENFAIYPSIHPYTEYAQANNFISCRGKYIFDTYTPIMKETYESALRSAEIAISGAKLLVAGEPLVYCLTRPSGHHAMKSMGGGMCYMNNSAIAAQWMLNNGNNKLAILDIDFHHGNGTQDIYYESPKVLVVNLHGDPNVTYPHFTGYPEEIGKGDGEGFNRNYPLPPKTSNDRYQSTFVEAVSNLSSFQPEKIIVSAGFDTHEKDPLGTFALTTAYYNLLGKTINNLDVPTLVIQEGGYATDYLGLNVVSFLKGLSQQT